MRSAITAVIVAHNEEHNMEDCINSINWTDEIIVLNAGSKDKTAAIALSLGAKVIDGSNQNNPEINKNIAFQTAKGPWIFSIDADERITAGLREEIAEILNGPSQFVAYWIPRQNMWAGRWIKYYRGPYLIKDYQLRLFQKGKGEYPAQTVDQSLSIRGPIGKLNNYLFHESSQGKDDVFHQINKINKYSTVHAKYLAEAGLKPKLYHMLILPFWEFLKHYFILFGYLNGVPGLIADIFRGFKIFIYYTKVWEIQHNSKRGRSDYPK